MKSLLLISLSFLLIMNGVDTYGQTTKDQKKHLFSVYGGTSLSDHYGSLQIKDYLIGGNYRFQKHLEGGITIGGNQDEYSNRLVLGLQAKVFIIDPAKRFTPYVNTRYEWMVYKNRVTTQFSSKEDTYRSNITTLLAGINIRLYKQFDYFVEYGVLEAGKNIAGIVYSGNFYTGLRYNF